MSEVASPLRDAAELRRRAEERLLSAATSAPASPEEMHRLLHELQVHHIELEMQNEELRGARQEVEAALAKYADLYDFAPVGYFGLDNLGTVRSANLTGATLLGIERSQLLGRRFHLFVAAESLPAFDSFLARACASSSKESCELRLRSKGGDSLLVGIQATSTGDGLGCRVAVSDITERRTAESERDRSLTQQQTSAQALQAANRELRASLADSERRRAEVSALLEGSRAVLKHREFGSAARSVFGACKSLIGAQAGYVALLNRDGTHNEVVFLDAGDLPCAVDPALPMPIRGLRERAYRTGQVVYDNHFDQSEWLSLMPPGHAVLDNVLFAPLVSEGRAMGLLGLANKPGGFDADDARMASAFAEMCTIALLNSRDLGALEESEAKFRALFRVLPAGVSILDSDRRVVDANPAIGRILGLSQTELLSGQYSRRRYLRSDGTPMSPTEFPSTVALREQRTVGDVEVGVLQEDGAVVWTSVSAVPFSAPDWRVIVTTVDITERKRSEMEREALLAQVQSERAHARSLASVLQTERDTLDAVFAAMVESVFIFDAQGKTVTANPAARRVFGLDPVDMSTYELFERVQVLQLDGARASFEDLPRTRALRGETVNSVRQKVRNALGQEFTVLATAAPLFANGQIAGAVAVWHDITAQGQAAAAREVHLSRLNRLVEIAADVLAQRTTEGVLSCVVDAAREVTGARLGVAGHTFHDGRFEVGLSSRAAGLAECRAGREFAIERGGVYLDLVRNVTALRLTDAALRRHPAWWGLPEGHSELHGLLGARLVGRDSRATGLIMVTDKPQGDFGDEDEALLTQLAALTSLGLQHIEAHAEAENRARESEEGRHMLLEAQEELRRAHDGLESRVRERTAELARANADLQTEILERLRAEQALLRRNQELATLNAMAAAISSSLEFPAMLASLQDVMRERLESFGGAIYSCDAADRRLYLETHWGLPPDILSKLQAPDPALPDADGEVPQVPGGHTLGGGVRRGAPFSGLGLSRTQTEWTSYLRVQLMAKGVVQGAAYLFKQTPGPFTEDQVAFFRAAAQQVGVAMQNARLFEQVRADQEQLRTLSRRLVEVQEAERRHIARELHDEIGQVLTSLKLSLQMSRRLPPEAADARLEEALANANALMAHVRDLSLHLRPPMLDDLGLLPALLWHLRHYAEETGITPQFRHSGLEQRFPAEIETAAYRIVQEALTNVARHAGVTEVVVRLWGDHGNLCVQVEDRGLGFDPAVASAAPSSSGLIGMRERASLLGGQLTIETSPGAGTRITAELPLHL